MFYTGVASYKDIVGVHHAFSYDLNLTSNIQENKS